MIQHTITDQPTVLRLLVEQGMQNKIQPLHKDRLGCVAMFPDRDTDIANTASTGTFYIVDKIEDFYTVTVLQECNLQKAFEAYQEYAYRFVRHPADLRVNITDKHAPNNN